MLENRLHIIRISPSCICAKSYPACPIEMKFFDGLNTFICTYILQVITPRIIMHLSNKK